MIWLLRFLVFAGVFWTGISARASSLPLTQAGGMTGAGLTINLVCANGDNGVASTVSCTTTAAIPSNATTVIIIGTRSNVSVSISSVTDSASRPYGELNSALDFVNASSSWHWGSSFATGLASGSTITATYSGSIASHFIAAYVINQTLVLGTVASATSAATTTNPTCTTSGSTGVGTAVIGSAGPMTFNGSGSQTGWIVAYDTVYASTHRVVVASQIPSSAAAVTFNPTGYTGTSSWSCLVTELKP